MSDQMRRRVQRVRALLPLFACLLVACVWYALNSSQRDFSVLQALCPTSPTSKDELPICVATRRGACVSLSSGELRPCPQGYPAEACHMLPEAQAVPEICAVVLVSAASVGCPCTLPSKLLRLVLEVGMPMELSLLVGRGIDDLCAQSAYRQLQEAGIPVSTCYGEKCARSVVYSCRARMAVITRDTLEIAEPGFFRHLLSAAVQMPGSVLSPSLFSRSGSAIFATDSSEFELTQVESLPIVCLLGHTEDFTSYEAQQLFSQPSFSGASLFVHGERVQADVDRVDLQPIKGRSVLFIDGYLPTPDKDSGSKRTSALISLLVQRGYRVSFQAIVTLEDVHLATAAECAKYEAMMVALGARVLAPGMPHTWRADAYDIVIVSRRESMTKVLDQLRQLFPSAGVVYDTVDLHFLRETRLAMASAVARDTNITTGIAQMNAWLNDPVNQRTSARLNEMRDLELSYISKSDVTIVVSPYEQDVIKQYLPSAPVVVISNIVVPPPGFDIRHSPPCSERSSLLFVGQFGHTPNQQAIDVLLKYIIPDMLQRSAWLTMPNIHIVGSGKLPRLLRQRIAHHAFMHIHTDLSDLELHFLYMETRVAIAPLVSGAGVKGKINQAMSLGVPVVATSLAMEGMHMVHGRDCMVAETLQQFTDLLQAVYFDDALCNSLARNAYASVYKHFSIQEARSQLVKALDRLSMVRGSDMLAS